MHIWLSIIAMLAYSLQATLMASYYRSIDGLSAVTYRGLSLGFSMLPLLLIAEPPGSEQLASLLYYSFLAVASSGFAVWTVVFAYRAFPVGVAMAIGQSAMILSATMLAVAVLGESLSLIELCGLLVIIFLNLSILTDRRAIHFDARATFKIGIICALLYGFFNSLAYLFVTEGSREVHPFTVGYCWEFGIGLLLGTIAIIRGAITGTGLQKLPAKDYFKIALYSSPTAVGTACFSYAVTHGPMAISSAITSSTMVASAVFALFFFGEKLSSRQSGSLIVLAIVIALLQIYK